MTQTFIDTIIVVSCTGLVIITTGVWNQTDPATGQKLADVANLGAADAQRAEGHGRAGWPPAVRGSVLGSLAVRSGGGRRFGGVMPGRLRQGLPRFSYQVRQKRTKWREGCLGSISSAAHQRRHSTSR